MRTPAKPADIASQRRQPTRSRKCERRAKGDGQRQRLKDRGGIGQRQMNDRGQERDGAADFGGHAQRHRRHHGGARRTQRAAVIRQRRNQHGGEQAPHQHHLAEIHLRRHGLGDGVVHREARHAHDHEQASANVGGKGQPIRIPNRDGRQRRATACHRPRKRTIQYSRDARDKAESRGVLDTRACAGYDESRAWTRRGSLTPRRPFARKPRSPLRAAPCGRPIREPWRWPRCRRGHGRRCLA